MNVFQNKKNSTEKNEAIIQTSKAKYLSANEAFKLASQKCSILPTETIFEQIYMYAKEGYRCTQFNDAYINGEQFTMLEEFGYKVKIGTSDIGRPYFKVSW